ncbi:MAG: hypothetical protein K0R50_441 [Eubacterium sp.]|jgi:predicted amidophosphoribosyltransferase|nr:hypothetical protein [Eubacterium sp.]
MAEFLRKENGIGWLNITCAELINYSKNLMPRCDNCNTHFSFDDGIILVPLLNQAYCPQCGKEVLEHMVNYQEDRPCAERKEQFWLDYFGLKDDTTGGI